MESMEDRESSNTVVFLIDVGHYLRNDLIFLFAGEYLISCIFIELPILKFL